MNSNAAKYQLHNDPKSCSKRSSLEGKRATPGSVLGSAGDAMGRLGSALGRLGGAMGVFWGVLESYWGRLSAVMGAPCVGIWGVFEGPGMFRHHYGASATRFTYLAGVLHLDGVL